MSEIATIDDENEFSRAMGQILREYRLQADLSQESLAGILCVHPNTVSNYERGLGRLPVALFCRICDALEIQAGQVFREAERRGVK
jgi:transcriptional regulator with XRE-family HTH domain